MHYHSQRDLYEDLDGGRGAERIQRTKEVQVSDVKAAAEQWPTPKDPCGRLHNPITEDWLRSHEFRIEDGRNDGRLPVRRLLCGFDGVDGRQMFESPDDLCIDVAPNRDGKWFVWIMQVEPYRHIHVRHMKYTWELAKLYEGLTGRVWPGTL